MLKTFSIGGVHPPENKLSAQKPIAQLPLPASVSIPLSQHIGAPAMAAVKKGDPVKVGTLIGRSAGFVSSFVHSSVSGTVSKVEATKDGSGYPKLTVHIAVEGDEWEEAIDRSDELVTSCALAPDEIIKKIAEAGIVGLGGATFPSHVKLSVPKGKTAQMLIINGVECEPYLTADHRLMLELGAEMVQGVRLLMKALGVEKAIIGIENNKPDAIEAIKAKIAGYPGISVQPLKVQYPQGGEKQLINACTGLEVPSGGLPIDVGCVVHNVGTAFAVYQAIAKNKPLLERIVTVTGKGLSSPSNFMVRIGTPLLALIDACGGIPEGTSKIISGGPMMGRAVQTPETPVTKGTSGVLLMQGSESCRPAVSACIRCSRCVSVCPMGLEPYLLMTLAEKKLYDRAQASSVLDCIECGSCSYTCPAGRPLLDYLRLGKYNVLKSIRAKTQK
jgi:Na+-translocating ferredoxin:NAD+ oxidoreductase subunit C